MTCLNILNLLAVALALLAASNHVEAFQQQTGQYNRPIAHRAESLLPSGSAIMPKNYRQGSLLRVATTSDSGGLPDVMLRQIDQKIESYEKKEQRFEAQLQEAKAELEKFRATKLRYLANSQVEDDLKETPAAFMETTLRSAVKAMLWRVIAGSVTFFTSLRFSGSVRTALTIVGSDFFSKAATMFFGERLMNKSQAGRKGGADDVGRSLAKALLWRVFAIANTMTMSYVIAKDFSMASKIAGSDAIFKTGLMFVYERVWAKIEWGKEYVIEFSI